MKLTSQRTEMKSFPVRYIIYTIAALIITLIDLLFIDIIQIAGITPDLLLILCVWIALAEGQFIALFAAFGIGLFYDVLSADVIGTNALAKVAAVFVAGYFHKEGNLKKSLNSLRFVLVVLLSAVVHNIIYFFFYIKAGEISFVSFFLRYGVAASFYTTIISIIAILVKIPEKEIDID